MLIDGVVHPQVDQLLQGLVDEDDADEGGERLLCEARDVADERAGIRGHQQDAEEGRPQADAGPQGEVGEAVVPEGNRTRTRSTKTGAPPVRLDKDERTYLQNLKRIFSKTRTGPVLPRMVRG